MNRISRLWMLSGGICAAMLATAPADAQRRSDNGEQALARAVAGRVAGRPVNCINFRSIRSSRIIDGTAIVYDAGRTLYVNRPRSGARTLRRDDVLVTRTTGSQLCTIDSVRLVDSTSRFPRGFVTLGQFVPYARPRGSR
jgi:hypothetical protein